MSGSVWQGVINGDFLTVRDSLFRSTVFILIWNTVQDINRLVCIIDVALVDDHVSEAMHHICRDASLPQRNELALVTGNQLEKSF